MPSRAEIVSFDVCPPPWGADPWVPGAAPAIDIDLTVADPGREQDYAPVLEAIGFRLVIREQQVIREIYHRAFAAAGLLDK